MSSFSEMIRGKLSYRKAGLHRSSSTASWSKKTQREFSHTKPVEQLFVRSRYCGSCVPKKACEEFGAKLRVMVEKIQIRTSGRVGRIPQYDFSFPLWIE